MSSLRAVLASLAVAQMATAHRSFYAKGIFCEGGNTPGHFDNNNAVNSDPFFGVTFDEYWMSAMKNCTQFPPTDGSIVHLPVGGRVLGELSNSEGQTTLAFEGAYTSPWGDGLEHPDDMNGYYAGNGPEYCMQGAPQDQGDGMLHTSNHSTTRGTGLGISYVSDVSKVTLENHVIFSVNGSSPWKRITSYEVPADLPPCPAGGCICSFNWVVDGCGEPNVFHNIFRCDVIGSTSTKVLAPAKAANFAGDDPKNATAGAKQVLVPYNAISNGANTWWPDEQFMGPRYNEVFGFKDGAQNDIFLPGVGQGNIAPLTSTTCNYITNGPVVVTGSGTITIYEQTNQGGTKTTIPWVGGCCRGLAGSHQWHNFRSGKTSSGTCQVFSDNDCMTPVFQLTTNMTNSFNQLNAHGGSIMCQ